MLLAEWSVVLLLCGVLPCVPLMPPWWGVETVLLVPGLPGDDLSVVPLIVCGVMPLFGTSLGGEDPCCVWYPSRGEDLNFVPPHLGGGEDHTSMATVA